MRRSWVLMLILGVNSFYLSGAWAQAGADQASLWKRARGLMSRYAILLHQWDPQAQTPLAEALRPWEKEGRDLLEKLPQKSSFRTQLLQLQGDLAGLQRLQELAKACSKDSLNLLPAEHPQACLRDPLLITSGLTMSDLAPFLLREQLGHSLRLAEKEELLSLENAFGTIAESCPKPPPSDTAESLRKINSSITELKMAFADKRDTSLKEALSVSALPTRGSLLRPLLETLDIDQIFELDPLREKEFACALKKLLKERRERLEELEKTSFRDLPLNKIPLIPGNSPELLAQILTQQPVDVKRIPQDHPFCSWPAPYSAPALLAKHRQELLARWKEQWPHPPSYPLNHALWLRRSLAVAGRTGELGLLDQIDTKLMALIEQDLLDPDDYSWIMASFAHRKEPQRKKFFQEFEQYLKLIQKNSSYRQALGSITQIWRRQSAPRPFYRGALLVTLVEEGIPLDEWSGEANQKRFPPALDAQEQRPQLARMSFEELSSQYLQWKGPAPQAPSPHPVVQGFAHFLEDLIAPPAPTLTPGSTPNGAADLDATAPSSKTPQTAQKQRRWQKHLIPNLRDRRKPNRARRPEASARAKKEESPAVADNQGGAAPTQPGQDGTPSDEDPPPSSEEAAEETESDDAKLEREELASLFSLEREYLHEQYAQECTLEFDPMALESPTDPLVKSLQAFFKKRQEEAQEEDEDYESADKLSDLWDQFPQFIDIIWKGPILKELKKDEKLELTEEEEWALEDNAGCWEGDALFCAAPILRFPRVDYTMEPHLVLEVDGEEVEIKLGSCLADPPGLEELLNYPINLQFPPFKPIPGLRGSDYFIEQYGHY